jgi:hypothetical protein
MASYSRLPGSREIIFGQPGPLCTSVSATGRDGIVFPFPEESSFPVEQAARKGRILSTPPEQEEIPVGVPLHDCYRVEVKNLIKNLAQLSHFPARCFLQIAFFLPGQIACFQGGRLKERAAGAIPEWGITPWAPIPHSEVAT